MALRNLMAYLFMEYGTQFGQWQSRCACHVILINQIKIKS